MSKRLDKKRARKQARPNFPPRLAVRSVDDEGQVWHVRITGVEFVDSDDGITVSLEYPEEDRGAKCQTPA